jgi:hypothetical protein
MKRIFIPSLLDDNRFLRDGDPDYKKRLLALPDREKKALLYGDWDIFEGQYFSEFSQKNHVISPFEIPDSWRKYRTIDYGLDRLACLWIAVSCDGRFYVYRELCESNLTISAAAKKILELTPKKEDIYATLAPPDLWNRSQETGRSKATLFSEYGINFTKTSNDREAGWLCLKELLSAEDARLKIFSTCTEIITCLPALQIDKMRPSDCSTEPHAITHAPDALRGFAIFYARPESKNVDVPKTAWSRDMWEDYNGATDEERKYLKRKYGEPI